MAWRKMMLLAVTGGAACAPDLREDFPFDGELPSGVYAEHEEQADGTTITRVNATLKGSWVYLDLDAKAEVPAVEVGGTTWDLAFQRFKIISNGGVSGSGSVQVAPLPGGDFETLVQAPAGGYLRDAPDGADANSDLDSAFLIGDGWYEYSLAEHRLKPRDIVYVIDNGSAFYKLRMLSYYDQAGTAGRLSFRWGPVAAP